jgi:hypothetical protein
MAALAAVPSIKLADRSRHSGHSIAEIDSRRAVKLIQQLGLAHVKYAFLHIVEHHPFAVFDEANAGTKTRGGGGKGV